MNFNITETLESETIKQDPLANKLTALERRVKELETENFLIKTQKLIYEKEFEIDSKTGAYNVHYAKDTLAKYIDVARRGNQRTRNPRREAISIAFLSADHYLDQVQSFKQTLAVNRLQELVGIIKKYVKNGCRIGDQFAKASFSDHEFLLILPETDKEGTKTVLKKLFHTIERNYDDIVSLRYGIANYAADIVEESIRDDSKRIASRLIEYAKHEVRSGGIFSGKFELKANHTK